MPAGGRARGKRRRMLAAVLLGALAALLVVFGTGPYGWVNTVRVKRRQARLRREVMVNMVRNELLRQELRRIRQDSLYLESKAREKYGMVKPGETSYRFYPADSLRPKP